MARRAAVFLTWLLITAVGDGFLGMPSQAEAPPVEAGVAEAPESDMEDAAGLDGTAAEATVFADSPEMPPEDVAGTATTDGSPEPVPARPTPSRIRLKLDVQGEIFAPAGRDAPPLRRPIVVDARFDFVETPTDGDKEDPVERRYIDASAELRIDGKPRRSTLADDARTVKAVLRGTTPSPYLTDGFLSRDEMDLLETPFDPLLIDALRPSEPVVLGAAWDVAGDVIAGLLGIDTVESGGIKATFQEIVDDRASVKLSGIVDGAADGVPVHVTVDGSYTLPIDGPAAAGPVAFEHRVATLVITLQERREASHVAPGFDVEARLSIARTMELGDWAEQHAVSAAGGDARRRGNGSPGMVWQRDMAGRYDLVHDERWRMIEDGVEGLVMRFVDRGALVAQCSITALPRSPAQSPPTIAEVERDVERSLAGQFGRIEHSSEASRSDGVRFVRVVTAGRAGDLPFRWIHYVLTDAAGHRLAVTCMLEQSLEKRFGSADRELIDGITLPATEEVSAAKTPSPSPAPPDREARLPEESRTP